MDKANGHVQDLTAWAGPPRKPKPPKSRGPKSHAKQHADARMYAQGHIDKKDWRDATSIAIVGLYSLLHARVYGVLPAELDGPEYLAACSRARFVCKELHPQCAYEMVRWTWKNAENREQNRKDDSTDDFRPGPRRQEALMYDALKLLLDRMELHPIWTLLFLMAIGPKGIEINRKKD